MFENHHGTRRVLLLNASEEIIGLISWQKATVLFVNAKASRPFGFEDSYHIPQPHGKLFVLPSALVLNDYVYVPDRKKVVVTRRNILRRDCYTCQYCGTSLEEGGIATIDHIYPQCLGGKTEWTNVVACCKKCNSKKGSRTLQECGMKPLQKPFTPTRAHLTESLARYIRKYPQWERWHYSESV